MNKPQETYTFSRALHLMRYSSKKMRPTDWGSECYVEVDRGFIYRNCGKYKDLYYANSLEIMGNWVMVV